MTAWKLAQALKHNYGEAEAAPLYVVQSSTAAPVGPEGVFHAVFPLGKRTPVQRVAELTAATRLARRILAEVESRLEREMEKTGGALEHMEPPTSALARPAYELSQQGLEEHWSALQLLDAVLAGDDEDLLDEAVRLAERADATLEQAEQAATAVRREIPLVA